LDHSVADLKLTKPTIVEGDMWGLVVLLIDGSTEWRGREKSMALNISSSQPTDWRPKEKAPAINRCSSQPAERRPRGKATTPKISSSLPDVSILNRGWY
jgi:hypothetical protein